MPPIENNGSAAQPDDSYRSDRAKRTRNRVPQSCQPCRKRKLKCDRQHPACENCIKRDDEDSCIYVEPPEDEKTRALRARLEYLETQVQEISASLAAAKSNQQFDSTDETDIPIAEQFSKLKIHAKDDNAVYYGPNCRYGIVMEYPDVLQMHRKRYENFKCKLLGHTNQLLEDDFPTSIFPFSVFSTDFNLQAMLPERTLCDRLIVRYFECCNSLLAVIDAKAYWDQYLLLWSTTTTPAMSHFAITFFMIAIAARSLNDGHDLLPAISSEGQIGALRFSKRQKKFGQLALSQNKLLQKSSITNIQATLLLCLLEDQEYVRWNLLGLLGNMARIAGLYRDPNSFQELDDKTRNIRRRLWAYIYILDHTEAVHYGYPPNIAFGTFDCEPLENPSSALPDPDNTFLYWMFKLHAAFSASFPGVHGTQKSLSAVHNNDLKIQDILHELPPELSLPINYIPAVGETALEIIRRYTIACIVQGHFITLHRPYRSMSPFSKHAALTAAQNLAQYQSHIAALSPVLEPFEWFIEEFLDSHMFRAVAFLGCDLSHETENHLVGTIVRQVEVCSEQAKLKSLRKRDFVKTYGVLRAIQATFAEKQILPEPIEITPFATTDSSAEGSADGWGMEEVLTEPTFRWDEYLVDMVSDTNQDAI